MIKYVSYSSIMDTIIIGRIAHLELPLKIYLLYYAMLMRKFSKIVSLTGFDTGPKKWK